MEPTGTQMKNVPYVLLWEGRPIEELTKEELIEALKRCAEMQETALQHLSRRQYL